MRSIDKSAKKLPRPICENSMEINKGHRTDASCRMSVLKNLHMMLCERYEQSEDQAQVQEEWIKPRTFTTIVKDCFSKEQ